MPLQLTVIEILKTSFIGIENIIHMNIIFLNDMTEFSIEMKDLIFSNILDMSSFDSMNHIAFKI